MKSKVKIKGKSAKFIKENENQKTFNNDFINEMSTNVNSEESNEENGTTYEFTIDNEEDGIRIDTFLKNKIDTISRSFIQRIIDEDNLLVNGKKVKSSYKLKLNDDVIFNLPEIKELEVEAQDIPVDIIYEDEYIAVVNKPRGMVVHPAVGNLDGTLVNALLYHLDGLSGVNGVKRPGIVHRIDKDTSGLLVIAKNDVAHRVLSEQLKEHSMTREYFALCEGRFKDEEGTIVGNLARDPRNRLKYSVQGDGKHAVTHYKVLARYKNTTLLKVRLETGRTHQIRVHMTHIGHPLVGDTVYGFKNKGNKYEGQLLHAHKLGLVHPLTNEYIEFRRPVPQIFKEALIKNKREK